MPTISSLLEDLSAPSVFNQDGSRALAGNDPAQALRSEIAKTILPRQLTFSDERGRTITCVAASGRVVQVGHQTADATSGMSDLDTFAASARGLCVRTSLLDDVAPEAPAATGSKAISECQLIVVLNEASAPYLTFANEMECQARGNQQYLEKLRKLADHGLLDPQGDCHFAAFVSSVSEDQAVLACTFRDRILLALVTSQDLPEIRQAWQNSLTDRNNSDL